MWVEYRTITTYCNKSHIEKYRGKTFLHIIIMDMRSGKKGAATQTN